MAIFWQACRNLQTSLALIEGLPHTQAISLDVEDSTSLDNELSQVDLVISLIPYLLHEKVVRSAIRAKKHVVTTSYASPTLLALDEECTQAKITVLNEIGVDPGVDHLYAVKAVNDVHASGGKILSYESFAGGLPAPEASDNPLGYKFSWSARGVILSLQNPARYVEDGVLVEIPGDALMGSTKPVLIYPGYAFVTYPNRDSTIYREHYGIPEAQRLFRGTLRYQGYPEFAKALRDLGYLSQDSEIFSQSPKPKTWADLSKAILATNSAQESELIATTSSKLVDIGTKEKIVSGFRWLGLFSNTPISDVSTPFDAVVCTLEERLKFEPGERDLVFLHHKFQIEHKDGQREVRTFTLAEYGDPKGYSAMARLVGVPCGVATLQVLDGKISKRGVFAPTTEDIAKPLRDTLEEHGIKMKETRDVRGQGPTIP
ncbi:hypothetical protein HYALB_00011671 [Hymenoscyphus albidus]|uniref:Saccharopine dehydrogenase n=1 Tax=Hymenoscyphus albidus TaxID=595503 RepID=A0A9N9LSY6_9HELO|nr:hypothetical protein HYALB_00011671 [Hymenoscyphus albidus]